MAARKSRISKTPTPGHKTVTAADAAKRLLALRAASESFFDFVTFMEPSWTLAPFQKKLVTALDDLEKNRLLNADGQPVRNLLVTMPPRFAKSTFCTVYFPAYFMARDPSRYLMSCSYNSQLATDFGRQVRSIIEQPDIGRIFPDLGLDHSSRSAEVWRTTDMGAYFAVGIGGTTSGRPANCLVLDDPIKSRSDAESITQRNKTWNYYSSALATRLQPDNHGNDPVQIIVLTRWHPDDLAGRLMRTEDWAEGRWTHINFQAIYKGRGPSIARNKLPKDHPDYHPDLKKLTPSKRYIYGEVERSLWPTRFKLEDLKRRERLNPREFASLYQQQPYIEGGNMIKSEWWRYYPVDLRPESFANVVIAVDTAYKKSEMSDYSAAITLGMDRAGDIYVVDLLRGRFEFPELKQRMIGLNNTWRGKGLRAFYVEDKASGQSLIQELKRSSGVSVIPHKVVHDKIARTNAILPLIEGGRVFLPESAPWLDTFMTEMVQFPGGSHDDVVDALVVGLDVLSRQAVMPGDWDLSANLDQALTNVNHDQFGPSLNDKMKTNSKWNGWGL